ncbi:MAG: endonuclease [Flavobacteriales bacterium]
MCRTVLRLVLVALPFPLFAQPPAGYYEPAAGLYGEALRSALHDIIDDHAVLANSQLWAAYEACDAKPDGTVWDMYSDVPDGTPAYVYQFGVDQCGTYNEEGDCFNREHSFPQSWFNSSVPASTDLFHLYPTDAWANQKRGNNAYGEVGSTTWVGSNGSKLGTCIYPGCTGVAFEPIDAYKGDFARSYFYMLTRYLPELGSWNSPMMSGGEFLPWAENMLLEWHAADPVSPKEVARNNAVFNIQGNRNPFIDQPEWVSSIWGPSASVEEAWGRMIRTWVVEGDVHLRGLEAGQAIDARVMDTMGRTVVRRSARADGPLGTRLKAGAYLLLLEHQGVRTTRRLVVQ